MIVCGVIKSVDIIIYYGIDLTSSLKTTNVLSLFEFHTTAQIATAKLALKVQYWPIQKSNKIDSKITKFSWDNCNLLLTPNDFFIQKEVHMNWRTAKSKNNYMKIEMSILIFRNIRGIIHPSKLCIVFKIHISGILDL